MAVLINGDRRTVKTLVAQHALDVLDRRRKFFRNEELAQVELGGVDELAVGGPVARDAGHQDASDEKILFRDEDEVHFAFRSTFRVGADIGKTSAGKKILDAAPH